MVDGVICSQCCFPWSYCIKTKAWKSEQQGEKKVPLDLFFCLLCLTREFTFLLFLILIFFLSFIKMQCPPVDSIWASFPSLPDNINGELLSCSDPLSKLSSAVLAAPTITQAVGAKQTWHLDLSYLFCKEPRQARSTDAPRTASTIPRDYTAGHERWQQSWGVNSGVYRADKCRDILILSSLSHQ